MIKYAQETIGEPLFGDVWTENVKSQGMMERCGFARRPDFVMVRPDCVAYAWPATAKEEERLRFCRGAADTPPQHGGL